MAGSGPMFICCCLVALNNREGEGDGRTDRTRLTWLLCCLEMESCELFLLDGTGDEARLNQKTSLLNFTDLVIEEYRT
jgi:hypothetical protein